MENRKYLYLLLLPVAAVLICFLAWSLLLVVWESLFVEGRLSYGNYLSLFVRKLYRESLCTSLGFSVSMAVLKRLEMIYGNVSDRITPACAGKTFLNNRLYFSS